MNKPENTRRRSHKMLMCANVLSWRTPTREELLSFIEGRGATSKHQPKRRKPSALIVRRHLRPVDVYCYLKARFGEPNGFQNLLRKDDSDNWIHWDYHIKAGDEDVYVCGASREIHFIISEYMGDNDWRNLIAAIKADYERIAKEKAAVLKSLERWVVFHNKFIEIADICASLHSTITDSIGGYEAYKTCSFKTKQEHSKKSKLASKLAERSARLYQSCVQLSLLTPVMAEAFFNLLIVAFCKRAVRDNKRQYEAFIRSQIDTKIFDLPYKCEGFERSVDPHSDSYRHFKAVMDKRNHAIHGNCDPEREKVEQVYFEGKRPLFAEPGDHLGKFFEALEHLHQPEVVLKDYEGTQAFLWDLAACLTPDAAAKFYRIIEDRYPGYDIDRKVVGCLFPGHVLVAGAPGIRYDDELAAAWG